MDTPERFPLRQGVGERSPGFTLLEVVLTIFLLTGTALATALLVIPIARQTRMNREMQAADLEVKKVLERVQATPFTEILTVYPPGTSQPVPALDGGQIAVNYADPTADPLEVQVTLSWSSPDLQNMQKTFTTVRTE
jgi:hypothetical protein